MALREWVEGKPKSVKQVRKYLDGEARSDEPSMFLCCHKGGDGGRGRAKTFFNMLPKFVPGGGGGGGGGGEENRQER